MSVVSRAYPSGLQPVVSTANNINGNMQIHRRVSRTDLDSEQALQAEGTSVLIEGIDMNTLGVDDSESPSSSSATPFNRAISRIALQPWTRRSLLFLPPLFLILILRRQHRRCRGDLRAMGVPCHFSIIQSCMLLSLAVKFQIFSMNPIRYSKNPSIIQTSSL